MKRKYSILAISAFLLPLAFALPRAFAFNHPCIPTTLNELDTIKASLNQEPWKSGYAQLANTSTAKLDWVMDGPYENVSRKGSYDANLVPWQNSMSAVYNLARMWYFTGNNAYAQKAHDILLAWATTNTSFSGNEAGLALGDYAYRFGGGASILRGTWPGWTAADTVAVQNYFSNVLWMASAGWPVEGPANKGAIYLEAGIAIAVFCDNDPSKFEHVLNMFRTFHGTGLMDTLPTGQMGETGRDLGHSFGTLNAMAFFAEVAWKQGVDLYSELDNRLLACGEYWSRNTYTTDNPYIPYGTIDWQWMNNVSGPSTADRAAFYILRNAYKNRFGLPTPWIDRKLLEQPVNGDNFMFAKTADFTTATATPASFPTVSPASSGLTLTTLGNQTAGRSASYANGIWTMTGLGNGTWSDTTDDCQFAYQTMTGDCAMVAKVTSLPYTGSNEDRAGLMIRDNLTATVSQRAWIGIVPAAPMLMQSHMRGWTVNWAGTGYDDRSHQWPPGLPYWVKIERRGLQITTFASPDGASWSPLNCTYYGNLPSTLYIGLFMCSGNTTANTVTFENVAFTGGTGGLVTTPAAPLGVLASGSNQTITVRWLGSYGATAYDLLRSTTSGSGYTVIASDLAAAKTSYVDTAVTAGTTYYYVVQAKNSAGTSGNSPESGAALLSAPMINLAFGGTATASFNDNSTTENSTMAFDRNPGTKWFGYNAPTGWIQYDFGAGNEQVVKRYTINCADVATRDPKNWNFLGSQDGSTWTTLDSQSGQSFVIRMGSNTYDIGNSTAYRYYRLDITANNGDTGVAVAELGLWGDSGHTIPDGRYRLVNRHSNKVADVTGGSTGNGALLMQSGWNGGDSQQWDIVWQGNGQYRATGVASAKVIDNGGAANTGANLVIQPSSGGDSQLWTVVADRDGFYHVGSANSGLVVDVAGGSTADGVNIVQSTYSGGDSQLWMPSIGSAPLAVPPSPTGLAATAASISQINLSWAASPGALHYKIKRATTNGGPYTSLPGEVNATTWSDTGLSSATTYYYVVSALNGSGESADSSEASATTLAAPPAAPTSFTTVPGTNQATLTWTASGGATSYTVQRATTSGGPYTTVAQGLTGTTYTDPALTNDVTYYYIVFAVNANGTGPASAEMSVTPNTLVAYLKFDESGGTVAADSSGRGYNATLVNAPTFAAGAFGNALTLLATSGQYAKLPSGIASGITDFTVSAWIKVNTFANWQRIFDFGTGTNNYMYFTTQYTTTAPNAAKLRFGIRTPSIAEQSVNGTNIALTAGAWTHVAVTRSGSTVSLYVNGALAGSGTIALSPSDLGPTTLNYLGKSQFNDPYLNGAIDDFRFYAQAMSPTQIAAFAHPAAGAPMQLAVAPGDTQAILTWLPNGTSSYTVKRSATSGGPYVTLATGLTNTTFTDTGLTNGSTYYYVVSGANADGAGPDSSEVSVTPSTLVLYYKFDETNGSVAVDSRAGRNATLVNGAGFAAGIINNALDLPATASQYAKLPSGLVSGLTDFTISTWIKVNTFATWQRIFDFGTGTTNYMFLTAQGPAGAGRPRFAIRTASVAEQRVDSSMAITAGAWTHIAVTRSGTTVSIYVNGAFAGSSPTAVTLNPSDLGVTTLNYLGKSQFNDPYLNGRLDDFRLYTRALSASDIMALASPLAAPQNFAATPGPLSVNLTWSAVPNATSYTVKYATTSGGPYATLASGLSSTSQVHSGLNAGVTYYYIVSAANSLYDGPASAEFTGAANQAPASLALGTLAFTYDGTPKATTLTTTPAGLEVHVTYDGSATAPTNAGSYAVTATVIDDNYFGSTTGTLTIAKAPLSIAANPQTKVYGYADPALTYTVSGLQADDTAAGVLTGALGRAVGENVDRYPIGQGTLVANGNYVVSFAGATLAITPRPASVTPNAAAKIYGAADPVLTGALVGFLPADNVTATFTRTAGENVANGSYTISAALSSTGLLSNYAITTNTAAFTIMPASLTVVANAQTKVYGSADPALTYTVGGLQFADTATGVLTGALSRVAGENVKGSPYAIQQGTLHANANYVLGFTGANLVITPAAANVSVQGYAVTYDGAAHTATGTGTGVKGEALGGLDLAGTVHTNAGTYSTDAWTFTDPAGNYASTGGTVSDQIAKAPVTITLALLDQMYDGAPKPVTATTTESPAASNLPVTITYNDSTEAPTLPGSYDVVATVVDPNYAGTLAATETVGITALVRHGLSLGGEIDGSIQVVLPENDTLNGHGLIAGDLLVPGTPTVRTNGHPTYGSTVDYTGSATPSNYTVTLGGEAVLRHVGRRVDALALPVVDAPPRPAGTRNVTLDEDNPNAGDFATINNLTVHGDSQLALAVPPGTYGTLTADGEGTIVLGVAGSTTPAVYNFQGLVLNDHCQVQIAGPVVITVATAVGLNGAIGNPAHPEWLMLRIASGGVTLNGDATLQGTIIAPASAASAGTVTINGEASITGGVVADRLIVNGDGYLAQPGIARATAGTDR